MGDRGPSAFARMFRIYSWSAEISALRALAKCGSCTVIEDDFVERIHVTTTVDAPPTVCSWMSRLAVRAPAGVLVATATFACTNNPETPNARRATTDSSLFTVSSPQPLRAVLGDVVYVALPTGSIPNAGLITIRVSPRGSTLTVNAVDGGLDPIVIPATLGDTLHIDVSLTGLADVARNVIPVAGHSHPVVIRTSPSQGKSSVSLNADMLVVFSEPILPSSLTSATVQLTVGSKRVGGRLGFTDSTHVMSTFTPDAPLATGTSYTLTIMPGIQNVFGQTLLAPVTVSFTSEATTFPPWSATALHMQGVSGIHTATLLPTGGVLLAGGSDGWTEDWNEAGQPDAEVYDPQTGVFAVTGKMTDSRTRAAATLLPNGKVLLTGGEGVGSDQPPGLYSAELYDPTVGRFSAAGFMSVVRLAHTATLLENGKVLIAGGGDDAGWGFPVFGTATATAELYDPATNSFTPTGPMRTPRFAHTATLLSDGRVLIAGGFSSAVVNGPAVPLSSTEIYDPATGVFTPASNMWSARGGHAATLLPSGAVLITGGLVTVGTGWPDLHELGSSSVLSSAELRDPRTGEFMSAGDMTAEREEHTATLLPSGEVLIAGGATGSNGTLNTIEVYDPATGVFAVAGTMTTPRSGHSATLLPDGTVLIAGGYSAGGRFDTGYHPKSQTAEILKLPQ